MKRRNLADLRPPRTDPRSDRALRRIAGCRVGQLTVWSPGKRRSRCASTVGAEAPIGSGRGQPLKDLEELPVNMRQSWTKRKAKVFLNQQCTGCYAMFQPLRQILKLVRGQCAHFQREDTFAHFLRARAAPPEDENISRNKWPGEQEF